VVAARTPSRTAALRLLALAASVSPAFVGPAGASSRNVSIRLFRSAAIVRPLSIAAGPDGAMWFTSDQTAALERITDRGAVTTGLAAATPATGTITNGRDGALWFSDGGSLARLSLRGALTEYPGGGPGIAAGLHGGHWFTTGGKYVGRVTATGAMKTIASRKLRGTYGIARGRDGAMWVTNYLGSSIARVDDTGTVRVFSAPCVRYPTGITAGPDGALWFTDDSGAIGRITTSGKITCFGNEALVGHPDAIVAGGDGALWATDRNGSILRITTHGAVTRYAPAGLRFPNSIAGGPRGTVWFTDYVASAIGRITRRGAAATPSRPKPLPRVTFISDSVAAPIAFDPGAESILANGIDLFFEPGQARTLGPARATGIAPPTVLDLIAQLGPRLGPTVVVEIGNNDFSSTYAANMESALKALRHAGVKHVLWLTLHVTPKHTTYAVMNAAIAAAAARHPELSVLDWNAYAAAHPEWFQGDGVHLTGDGPRALAEFVRAGLASIGLPRAQALHVAATD
jgi:virginiamycin B lyase